MELPQRKPNRLPNYSYSGEGAYFITVCTQNRRNLLSEIVGGGALDAPQTVLTALGQIVEQCIQTGNGIENIRVDKYVIMPNHIHMILFIKESTIVPVSRANEKIPRFIAYFKRSCHQRGQASFFQRSYHDHVIRNEQDYLRIWQYIDQNPALWKQDCFYNT